MTQFRKRVYIAENTVFSGFLIRIASGAVPVLDSWGGAVAALSAPVMTLNVLSLQELVVDVAVVTSFRHADLS